jgi:Putative prokaryotic signal transducing protein
MPHLDNYAWVPLFRALDQVQARLVAARLDDQRIPVTIRDESASQSIPVQFGMMAEIIILVPDEYYDRALAILVDLGIVDDEEDDDLDDE